MKLLFLFFSLASFSLAQAKTGNESVQDRILQNSGLASVTPGFRLSYSLTLFQPGNKSLSGTYTLTGKGKAWKSEVVLPNYSDVSWHRDKSQWRKSQAFAPLPATRAESAIETVVFGPQTASFYDVSKVEKKHRKISGKETLCLNVKTTREQWCFDGNVLVESARDSLGSRYEQWSPFEGRNVPSVVTLFEDGRKVSQLRLTEAKIDDIGSAELQPTSDAVTIIDCAGKVDLPDLLHKTEPEFTEEARKKHVQGTVTVGTEITNSGQANPVALLRSIPELDRAAITAISSWRFKPAKCDGNPIRYYATIEVDFKLW